MSWATPGMQVRCIDAKVRKTLPGAVYSDFEKRQANILEMLEVLTVREVEQCRQFGGAWAVRFVELERGIELIRRHRAKQVMAIDRPFFLDRFIKAAPDADGDGEPAPAPPPRERENA